MTSSNSGQSQKQPPENDDLELRIKELEEKLAESQETLRAIQSGEVDAIMINADGKEQIFTLAGAEEPYRVLFEQMNEGAVTIAQDCGILYSNQSFASVMKSSLERVIGSNICDFIQSSDAAAFMDLLNQSVSGPVRHEMTLKARDGTLVPMQLSISHLPSASEPTYSIVLADLSERIRAEEALKKSHDELETRVKERTSELRESMEEARRHSEEVEALMNSIPSGIWVAHDPKSSIITSNQVAKRLYEQEKGEETTASGEEWTRPRRFFKDGVEIKPEELPLQMAASQGIKVKDAEIETILPSGKRVVSLTNAVPLFDEKGKVRGAISSSADITERKKAEEALRRSNEELQQFAYISSHDLQEPLRMVTSYLGLLERRYGDELSGEAKEFMGFAIDGATRMRELIDDLLSYSRVESKAKPFAQVDMNQAFAKARENLNDSIETNHAKVTADELPTVTADETQMVQLLQNLLSNAIKFHGAETPEVRVSPRENWAVWTFAVNDNGIGIPPQYQDKIFEMFHRLHTREEYEGTGIGLAIAKKIVERHGGEIWVESEGKGKGSTFFFTIPKKT